MTPGGRLVMSAHIVRSTRATRKWSSLFGRLKPVWESPPKSTRDCRTDPAGRADYGRRTWKLSTSTRGLPELRPKVLAEGHVRAEFHEVVARLNVHEERSRSVFALRDEPRRLAALVDDVDLRPAIDEELHHRRRPEVDRADDRRLPQVVRRIDVVSELEAIRDGLARGLLQCGGVVREPAAAVLVLALDEVHAGRHHQRRR